MATNTAAYFGFSQTQGTGSSPTYELIEQSIDYNTANIFWGDPVGRISTSDSTIAGITTGNLPGTQPVNGVFYGCKYLSVAQKRTVWSNWWPGSDVASGNFATGYVVQDPNAKFIVQAGNTGSNGITTANLGLNAQFFYGTGNTTSGISGAGIDASVSPAATTTLPFRLLSLVTDPPGQNGTNSGVYNLVIVGFNNVETRTLGTGLV